MTDEKKTKRQQLKHGISAFVVTFGILLALFTAQILYKYKEDIFTRNLDAFIVVKIILLFLLSSVTLSLPSGILAATTIYYRQMCRLAQMVRIRTSLVFSLLISIVCFVWIAFIAPVANLHMMSLLFDIRSKHPDQALMRTDLSFFRGYPMTSNYFRLGHVIDSLSKPVSNQNDNYLFQINDYNARQSLKFQAERAAMIGFPVFVFILFYLGMFLGILNRKSKLVFIILGFCFILIPGMYLLSVYLKALVKTSILTPFFSEFTFLSVMTVLTLIIFIITNRLEKTQKSYCW